MSLLFQDEHIPLIRDGEKTATRRLWDENYPHPNIGSFRAATTEMFTPKEECDCWIEIEDVYEQRLGDMSLQDYAKEGNYSPEEFERVFRDLYDIWDPHLVVNVVEFQYVGREPRDPQRKLTECGP